MHRLQSYTFQSENCCSCISFQLKLPYSNIQNTTLNCIPFHTIISSKKICIIQNHTSAFCMRTHPAVYRLNCTWKIHESYRNMLKYYGVHFSYGPCIGRSQKLRFCVPDHKNRVDMQINVLARPNDMALLSGIFAAFFGIGSRFGRSRKCPDELINKCYRWRFRGFRCVLEICVFVKRSRKSTFARIKL